MRTVTLQAPGDQPLTRPVAPLLHRLVSRRRHPAPGVRVAPAAAARPRVPDPPSPWRAALQALAACLVAAVVGGFALGTVFTRVVELLLERLAM
jgi:hypothetical protein